MTAWLRRTLLVAGVAVAAGSTAYVVERHASATNASLAQTSAAGTGTGSAPVPAPPRTTADLLRSMAALTGKLADPAQLAPWAKRVEAGEPMDGFIDELLRNDRFSQEVVPSLLFGSFVNVRNYYALPSGFVLKRIDVGGVAVFYLREPCAPAEAVGVHPWWNIATEVKVCPDTYRPEKWTMDPSEHSYRSRMPLSCDSQVGSPELETQPLCGCGPNLIRCMRDEAQWHQFNRSMMDEVKLTTAYVVEHGLPIKTLFTGTSTVRDRSMELYYLRQKIGASQIAHPDADIAKLGSWPEPPATTAATGWESPRWAPREELASGQHAGLLTAPQILHWLPDRRQRQRGYYEILWCNLRNSFGATTQRVLDLNATANIAFVHDSWKRLAHTEVCTNCHARLDYGFQFMLGYTDSRAGIFFNPSLETPGNGPLYARDIDDPRGSAALTPAGFAELATEQPEFKTCMANHVVDYVLGDNATPDDRDVIEAEISNTGNFKTAFKLALERYADHWRAAAPAAAPMVPSPPPDTLAQFGLVNIAQPLRAKLDEHCLDCHDHVPYSSHWDAPDDPFDFRPSPLPRARVVAMLDRVAFGMMPKDTQMPPADREELVHLLINTLWSDPAAQAEAATYYLTGLRGLPALQIDNSLFRVDQVARSTAPPTSWGALERGLWTDQDTITPGLLTTTALEALRVCKAATTERGTKLGDCLGQALSVQSLSRSPIAAPP